MFGVSRILRPKIIQGGVKGSQGFPRNPKSAWVPKMIDLDDLYGVLSWFGNTTISSVISGCSGNISKSPVAISLGPQIVHINLWCLFDSPKSDQLFRVQKNATHVVMTLRTFEDPKEMQIGLSSFFMFCKEFCLWGQSSCEFWVPKSPVFGLSRLTQTS